MVPHVTTKLSVIWVSISVCISVRRTTTVVLHISNCFLEHFPEKQANKQKTITRLLLTRPSRQQQPQLQLSK